jgi:hypothetical protein
MAGIMRTGRQYAESALTGAITTDANTAARAKARQGLDLQERALDLQRRNQEKQAALARKAANRQLGTSGGMLAGAAIGFALGGPVGAVVGGLAGGGAGGVLGGLF